MPDLCGRDVEQTLLVVNPQITGGGRQAAVSEQQLDGRSVPDSSTGEGGEFFRISGLTVLPW
jgi:hypothetical protein